MPPLAKALLRYWWSPEFALASARVRYAEALATGCPVQSREWRSAVLWIEWIVGPRARKLVVPSLKQALDSIVVQDEDSDDFEGVITDED